MSLIEFDNWLEKCMQKKEPMAKLAYNFILEYSINYDIKKLNNVTFKYIVNYFETNEIHDRLNIACADIGYSPLEISDIKKSGRTIQDITTEILARGYKEYKDGKCVHVKPT